MGLWSKVKGKGTQFKGPKPIGEVVMDIYALLTFPIFEFLICFLYFWSIPDNMKWSLIVYSIGH